MVHDGPRVRSLVNCAGSDYVFHRLVVAARPFDSSGRLHRPTTNCWSDLTPMLVALPARAAARLSTILQGYLLSSAVTCHLPLRLTYVVRYVRLVSTEAPMLLML